MRQNQRGGKRLPYKRKRGKACCTPNSWSYLGRKPYTSRRVVSASFAVPRPPRPALPARPLYPRAGQPCHAGPPSGPAPAALAPVFTPALPAAPFGALSARHAQRQGFPAPCRRARHAARVRPTWAWHVPRRFCARPGCAVRRLGPRPCARLARPPALARPRAPSRLCLPRRPAVRPCARATGLPPRLCLPRRPPRPPRGDRIFANGSQETAAPSRVNFREIADRGYCPKNTKSAPV